MNLNDAQFDPPISSTGDPSPPPRRFRSWRLWIPLLLQSVLIVGIPAQDAYTHVTGRSVTLQTAPVDPYDLLRGYSQTLRYDISRVSDLKEIPGGPAVFKELSQRQRSTLYLVLQAPSQSLQQPPIPWRPVEVRLSAPEKLPENQVVLKGITTRSSVKYGLERYYMPEPQRDQINQDISSIRQQPRAFVVDIKVDPQGNSVPVALWIRDRKYRF